jgi:hypothetical protein
MIMARPILAVLLALMLLPWGAHLRAAETVRMAEIAAVATGAADTAVAAAKRPCRSATLPGQSCVPDRALLATGGAAPPEPAARRIAADIAERLPAGRVPVPETGPPRG